MLLVKGWVILMETKRRNVSISEKSKKSQKEEKKKKERRVSIGKPVQI